MPASTAWTPTTLGQLGRYLNGRGFKKSEWSDRGRPIIRIQNLTGSSDVVNRFVGEVDDRHVVHPGDLLVSWAATLGAYVWTGEEGVLNQHIFKVESFINPRFHKHLLDHKLAELMRHTHGSGMVHITRSNFDNVPVAVPDSSEQQRIVDILEDHLSRLDAADHLVENSAARLTSLVESALRASPELEGAPTLPLRDLLSQPLINGRSVPTRTGGFPVLRLTALHDDRVRLSERKSGAWTAVDAEPFLVARHDIFVSRGSGSLSLVGRASRVVDEPGPVAFPDTMMRVRVDESRIDPAYLVEAWNSRLVRRQIERAARTTAGIYKINQAQLSSFELLVPARAAQSRVLARLSYVREAAETTARQAKITKGRSRSLRSALLAAAFSGRLTGHASDMDRAEELAS